MNKKVLIIDDDEELCIELKEILSDEGYEVDVAMDGRQGNALIVQGQYAVVILDLKLPVMNGYEVLQTAKDNANSCKIIVLSGRPLGENPFKQNDAQEEEDRILSLAEAVMNKPVHVPLLLEKVKELSRF